MIIIIENKKVNERSEDQKIQKMAYEFFQHLATRGLKPGQRIPDFDEVARQRHADGFAKGVAEFMNSLKDYTGGYMRSAMQDERKNKANYGTEAFDRVMNGIKAFARYV